MKKLIICIVALTSLQQLKAQDITGSFKGAITTPGGELHIIFHIQKAADGLLSATFDSPDQKAFGIACGQTSLVKDSLNVLIPVINGSYKGLWDGKDAIDGIFQQGAGRITLNMKRLTEADKAEPAKPLNRPQTPKPPFNYVSDDVEYDNADKSVHYGATFTKPKGEGKFPAVIIITGSGTQDRDGTIFGHKLYYVLADYLTNHGIAVLRVDDRGAGKSTLGPNIKNVTSLDFSYDVEASLNYLETRADIDKKHLGLIGHSEGGIIAPMVAARRKDVSFIVMWAGPAVGGEKINTEQNGYALLNAHINAEAVESFKVLHKQILDLFAGAADKESFNQQTLVVFDAWKKSRPQNILDALYVNGNAIVGKDLFAIYDGLYDLPWMRYFITYKPEKDIAKVKCAVLAVNGSKDIQVIASQNLPLIKDILTKNGNKDFEVKELPGLNHLFQNATTGDLSEYEKIEETMSPDAMNIICSWIKLHTK